MADTTTTYYGLTKPEIGASEDTWGAKLNGDMDLIDTQMKSSDDLSSAALPKAGGTMTGVISGFESTGIDDNATSTKFTVSNTGIDVTGTVTSDGLIVDGNSAYTAKTRFKYGNAFYADWGYASDGNKVHLKITDGGITKSVFSAKYDGDISFYNTAGTTAKFFWDASAESLGIGTSSPDFSAFGSSTTGVDITATTNASLRLNGNAADSLFFVSGSEEHWIYGKGAVPLSFSTNGTEAMRIDSAGTVLIGKSDSSLDIEGTAIFPTFARFTRAEAPAVQMNRQTSNGDILDFRFDGVAVGSVSVTGSATAYNTSSDHRLKTDVQPMVGATATFMQLNPVNFEWISSGERVDGFLAHELGEVIPAAATGTHNGMVDEEYEATAATGDIYTAGSDAGFNEVSPEVVGGPAYYDIDGVQIRAEIIAESAVHEAFDAVAEVIHSSDVEQPGTLEDGQAWRETTPQVMATRSVPDMQGIDQSKIVPILVATLQEALARIEALEE